MNKEERKEEETERQSDRRFKQEKEENFMGQFLLFLLHGPSLSQFHETVASHFRITREGKRRIKIPYKKVGSSR